MNGEPPRLDAAGPRYTHGQVASRRAPDAVIVLPLDPRAERPLVLSGTGIALWDAFAAPRTVDAATADLAARYETDVAEVATAIAAPLDALLACGALVEAP